jgi:ATP-dependent Clp protease adaptor protein ClpS
MAGLRDRLALAWRRLWSPRRVEIPADPDAQVVFHVARHEANQRRQAVTPLHLLYGLLQHEGFVAAVERAGGDATAIEHRIVEKLDTTPGLDDSAIAATVLDTAIAVAHHNGRLASCTDIWAYLSRTEAGRVMELDQVDPIAVLFLLAHGIREQDLSLSTASEVHVVLRNDDYTSFELVAQVLREVFELGEVAADTTMRGAHKTSRAIVGRYPLEVARRKVLAGRALARVHGAPLWLGLEDC